MITIQAAARRRGGGDPSLPVPGVPIHHQNFYNYCPVDAWKPAVNLYESADRYLVCVDLAGMRREEIDVSARDGVLVIAGTRGHPQPQQEAGDLSIHLMEVDQGPFCRSVEIPSEVDVDAIRANYGKDGFLWIELPKSK